MLALVQSLILSVAAPADVVSGCVWVRAENDTAGAGFVLVVKKTRLVTCRHIVGDRDRVDIFFAWKRNCSLIADKSAYLGYRQQLRDQGMLVTGTVVKKSDEADLALIEVESIPESVTALSLASTPVQPGDPVRVVGHRIDLDTLFNFTTGVVRQSGRLANGYHWRGRKLAVNADAILGQLPIEEGDSGGPVLNAMGEVVGMASALRRQAPLAAVAISASEIRRFLEIAEPKAKLPAPNIGDTLMRATVWVRPGSTDVFAAGTLIGKNLILTSSRGLGPFDRIGIAFPLRENGRWVGERDTYRDTLGLNLKGAWRAGLVIARDPVRDLALVRVESVPDSMCPVRMATIPPGVGDPIHAMSHPGGLEFAWVYSSGSVRQHGRIALSDGEASPRVRTNILQLPAQSASPGGPVLNDRGELIGVLSSRESGQHTGYSPSTEEFADFLDVALAEGPPRSIMGLVARADLAIRSSAAALAEAFVERSAAKGADAERNLRVAIALDPDSHRARKALLLLLLQSKRTEEYAAELDRMAERPRCLPAHVFMRAVARMDRSEWRAARADLERILEVLPDDALARRRLVRVLLELNKDEEAAAAVGDAVRGQDAGLRFLAPDLLAQADAMAKKFPDAPSVPANWLKTAIGAGPKFDPSDVRRKKCEVVLKAAVAAPDDAARLRILRDFLQSIN